MKTTIGDKTLFPHQVAAVQWMMAREDCDDYSGGFLCDEMGLGKTIMTIALLVNKRKSRTLLLAPVAVLRQWRHALLNADLAVYELEKHAWVRKGGSSLRGRVYLTNYDKLLNDAEVLKAVGAGRLVLDEAHIMRNDETKKYSALKAMEIRTKWFLTGTPVVNTLNDFSALVRLLNPGAIVHKNNAGDYMNSLALYRTQEDIRTHLSHILPKPAETKVHRIEFCSEDEAKFYRGVQGRLATQLEHLLEQDHLNLGLYIQLLMRLRQISSHPQCYIAAMRRNHVGYSRADWPADSSKTCAMLDIFKKDTNAHGYVIFCHFKDEMDVLAKRLAKCDEVAKVFQYHGSLSASQRADVLDACEKSIAKSRQVDQGSMFWLDQAKHLPQLPEDVCQYVIDPMIGGRHVVLLAQLQSAGTGLNLQFMDRVMFTTPWWTAALMDQAVGRVQRLGQTREVKVHHLMLAEEMDTSLNIDEYMNERVEEKRALCETLLAAADHTLLPSEE